MKNNVFIVKIRSIFNREKMANIKANVLQGRTKRQWLKILSSVVLTVGLISLAVVTAMLLTKKAPYEYNQEKLTVEYLQNKQQVADLKKVDSLSTFIEPDTTYIAYYTQDGQFAETDLASGILVSENVDSYKAILDQFVSSTTGCEIKSETLRGGNEYMRAVCEDALLDLYSYKTDKGGVILFSSDLDNQGLEKILLSY